MFARRASDAVDREKAADRPAKGLVAYIDFYLSPAIATRAAPAAPCRPWPPTCRG